MKALKIIIIVLIILLVMVIIIKNAIEKARAKEFEITEEDENYEPSEEEKKELEEGYGDDIIITPNPNIESYDK